ncbi:LacI family DNA-binding transcriptional regulator [Cryptosporangium minutisporangium]|uniref:LacI family DNA-binding transcriptional regulator n=1 Tax=Cryptosporangium minutisporangium TaxID=113569 RepID=A0ABP6T5F3_9ACTN
MSKRATSADVARAAGVSRTTVSFVLNNRPDQTIPDDTRRRVLDAARRLDYRPYASARTLAAGRSSVVLLAVPALPLGSNLGRFIEVFAGELSGYGLTLVTHLSGAQSRPLPDVCAALNASAVVALMPVDHSEVDALRRAGADVVLSQFSRGIDGPMGRVGRAQAEHLIARGHQSLGYAMSVHSETRPIAEARLSGVIDACAEAQLNPPVVVDVDLEVADAARAVAHWREQGVTGVCAINDETAIAVLAGLREHGLAAPKDLAIIGVDDIPTARLTDPPLTTVTFDVVKAARRRAQAVAAALAGEEVAFSGGFDSRLLIQRSST